MKIKFVALGMALLLAGITPAAFGAGPGNVRVTYTDPERFIDFNIQRQGERRSAKIFAEAVSSDLARSIAKRFPGATLSLRFTNIDLAGRYEPWRAPRGEYIRFYRNVTPLRLDFNYVLSDAGGRVLAQGSERLTDLNYLTRFGVQLPRDTYDDPLYYEKYALEHWVNGLARSISRG
jgi:Protein of unknown function (DUF3016)